MFISGFAEDTGGVWNEDVGTNGIGASAASVASEGSRRKGDAPPKEVESKSLTSKGTSSDASEDIASVAVVASLEASLSFVIAAWAFWSPSIWETSKPNINVCAIARSGFFVTSEAIVGATAGGIDGAVEAGNASPPSGGVPPIRTEGDAPLCVCSSANVPNGGVPVVCAEGGARVDGAANEGVPKAGVPVTCAGGGTADEAGNDGVPKAGVPVVCTGSAGSGRTAGDRSDGTTGDGVPKAGVPVVCVGGGIKTFAPYPPVILPKGGVPELSEETADCATVSA